MYVLKRVLSGRARSQPGRSNRRLRIGRMQHTATPFLLWSFLRRWFLSRAFWLFENSAIVPLTIYSFTDSFICEHCTTVIRKYFFFPAPLAPKHVPQIELPVMPLVVSRSISPPFSQIAFLINRLVVPFPELLVNCFKASANERSALLSYMWFNIIIIVRNYSITNPFIYFRRNCMDESILFIIN